MSGERLDVGVGLASETGRRPRNEDFVAADRPPGSRGARAFAAAIADGVGGGPGGRLAAEATVRAFLDGYFGLPATLGVERAAGQSLQAINRWLHGLARQDVGLRGMATTFSALLLRGREGFVLHAGDSRVYRLRDAGLHRLTADHAHDHPDLQHVLLRAVGLEDHVRADASRHELRVHDRYLLCTDGVHGALPDRRIEALLAARGDPQASAAQIVAAALEAGSRDNVTALVLDVLALPPLDQTGLEAQAIFGDWAWKLEAINRHGFGDRYAAFNAGFERTIVGVLGSRTDLGLVLEYLYDERDDEAFNTLFEHDLAFATRWNLNDVNDTQALLGVVWDVETDETIVKLETSRRLGDTWTVLMEGRAFAGADEPADDLEALFDPANKSAAWRDDDFIQIELTRYF